MTSLEVPFGGESVLSCVVEVLAELLPQVLKSGPDLAKGQVDTAIEAIPDLHPDPPVHVFSIV
jgi:hypothetical protein